MYCSVNCSATAALSLENVRRFSSAKRVIYALEQNRNHSYIFLRPACFGTKFRSKGVSWDAKFYGENENDKDHLRNMMRYRNVIPIPGNITWVGRVVSSSQVLKRIHCLDNQSIILPLSPSILTSIRSVFRSYSPEHDIFFSENT